MKKLIILAVAIALIIPAIVEAQVVRVGPGWYSYTRAPQWVKQPLSGVYTPLHPDYADAPCDWAGNSPVNGIPRGKTNVLKGIFGGLPRFHK
jgi:hypothetical protein